MQEAIPAASSTAKPQAEEVVSQGTASEPLAQECLRGNGNSRKTSEKHTKRIRRGRKTYDYIRTDGMTVMNQSLIFVSIIESLRMLRHIRLHMETFL